MKDHHKSSLLEPINESSQQIAISSVLLAASVAWADGVVQLNEKNKLIELAERERELDSDFPFQKVMTWLNEPPTEKEVEEAISILAHNSNSSGYIVNARQIAKAHGGIGIGLGLFISSLVGIIFLVMFNSSTALIVTLTTMVVFFLNHKVSNNAISQEEETVLNWLNTSISKDGFSEQQDITHSNWKQRIDTLRTVMDERSLAEKQERWNPNVDSKPTPCSQFPGRMPPTVSNIQEDEYQAFRSKIVNRYVQALIGET